MGKLSRFFSKLGHVQTVEWLVGLGFGTKITVATLVAAILGILAVLWSHSPAVVG